MKQWKTAIAGLAALTALTLPAPLRAGQAGKSPLKVFILAGQSNMEGQGVVDLDHERDYNGGKGNLEHVMRDPAKAKLYAHLKDKDGNWFGNAESYFLIGNALGEAMKKLLEAGAGG
jgi:hypothetical protein